MKPSEIHCFLVYPHKENDENPAEIRGTTIKKIGKTWDFLSEIFDKSESECDIGIDFKADADLGQMNAMRTVVVKFGKKPLAERAMELAKLLEAVTPGTAGIGLLFVMYGSQGKKRRVVLSRFPADSGLVADDTGSDLTVDFIEKLFLKDRRQYKCALYEADRDNVEQIWSGMAVDRQDHTDKLISNYWIYEFLHSDFSSTSVRGSRALAEGIKKAFNKAESVLVKSQLQAVLTLLPQYNRRRMSAAKLTQMFSVSEETSKALEEGMKRHTYGNVFSLDIDEFLSVAPNKMVILDSGAIMTAPADRFDKAFVQHDEDDGSVTFEASGRVVKTQLRKAQ